MAGDLQGFAVGMEELEEAASELREHRGVRDGRICVCGHPVSRHSEYMGRVSCSPTRMACPCGTVVPVIEVSDTRPFLRKTQGTGTTHSLMQGLYGLLEKGREWKWLPGFPVCMRCEAEGVAVLPFALNSTGMPSWEPEKVNVLLCEKCAVTVQRSGFGS